MDLCKRILILRIFSFAFYFWSLSLAFGFFWVSSFNYCFPIPFWWISLQNAAVFSICILENFNVFWDLHFLRMTGTVMNFSWSFKSLFYLVPIFHIIEFKHQMIWVLLLLKLEFLHTLKLQDPVLSLLLIVLGIWWVLKVQGRQLCGHCYI